jgi:transposase-like protein
MLVTQACATAMPGHAHPRNTYASGAVDACTGELDSLILPQVNTHRMQLFLKEVSACHPQETIVMVIDGAGWHRSGTLQAPNNIHLSPQAAALYARAQPD